jgi:hypothetical protein
MPRPQPYLLLLAAAGLWLSVAPKASATPSNKAALAKHYGRFLPKSLNQCATCHLPSDKKNPESLEEFPHNPFGDSLRKLGEQAEDAGRKMYLAERLTAAAREDADGDGADNETELLLGHNPGDAKDVPAEPELAEAPARRAEFAKMLASYRWDPLEAVKRPPVPAVKNARWVRNPIDAFVAQEHEARKLTPRPPAAKETLLRRLHLDLTGLAPTAEDVSAFLAETSPDAYEKAVDKLLASPGYGEHWARHWMDVWRYSDWTGYQNVPRDSKPHIWRWRDWIIESLNADRGYDRMVMEMLAADELSPADESALRATGYLARNFKALSREKWMEDTLGHTFQAFQGLTMNCAKCHDHMYDPISQREYFEARAIFEPHQVRTDRVPGEVDTGQEGDGLVRVYDATLASKTYVLARGDERKPIKTEEMQPNLPRVFNAKYEAKPVALPLLAARPDKREFIVHEDLAAGERALEEARKLLAKLQAGGSPGDAKALAGKAAKRATAAAAKLPAVLKPLPGAKTVPEAERNVALAEARLEAHRATAAAEQLEADKDSPEWKQAAEKAVVAQRKLAVLESKLACEEAETALTSAKATAKKNDAGGDKGVAAKSKALLSTAEKALAVATKALEKAEKDLGEPVTTAYAPAKFEVYPPTSTGRRLALAQWFASTKNPLTARVAANHIWAHYFGRGIVATLNDFGRNGQPPSHPQLLDWLAAELMAPSTGPAAEPWSQKHLHRLIVTSSAYRMASTPDAANAQVDRDNVFLWRMPSRRMEAEAVRDNLLHVGGNLDLTMGGPEIDQKLGLVSKRRSVYLRVAPEKEVELLKIFDGPNPVECYSRPVTVMPHQALALANNEITFSQARAIADALSKKLGTEGPDFINGAYERVLSRKPTAEEAKLCAEFLDQQTATLAATPPKGNTASAPDQRARENLVMVLFNHNDFVTIR